MLMTSNHADRLDKALVRPGRIDRMIFLGNISQRSAELMFLRMYAPEHEYETILPDATLELEDEELEKLALEFSSQIPENAFTPAQLQGYLLNRRKSPKIAAVEASTWVKEEKAVMEEAKARAKEAKAWRLKKRKTASMRHLSRSALENDLADGLADIGIDIRAERAAALRAIASGRNEGGVKSGVEATADMAADWEPKLKVELPIDAKGEADREVENKTSAVLEVVTTGDLKADTPAPSHSERTEGVN